MKTILTIDDEETNCMVIQKRLQDEYRIVAVNSPEKALEVLQKEKIDLILLDVLMPGMSGYELCSIIRAQEATKDIPIIFLTGKSSPEELKRGFEAGGNDYVIKPFNPIELKARISTQLELVDARLSALSRERLKTVNLMVVRLKHDIKNALAIMSGCLALMKKYKNVDDEKFASSSERAGDAIRRVVKVLDSIESLDDVVSESYAGNEQMLKLSSDE